MSIKSISSAFHLSRNTVRKYVRRYQESGLTLDQYLDIIRNRAFGSATAAKTDAYILQEGSLLNAVIQERGFEFAGEGDRRWTLIRTGLLPVKVREIKELTRQMFDGLKANGCYTFANGNTISEYIWTKYVDGKATNGGFKNGYGFKNE